MFKKYLVAAIVLAVVLAGGLYLAWNNQHKELRTAIASQASASLGVGVSIDDSEIVTEGIDQILKLSRLSVANPSGFSGRHAIRMAEVWIRYDGRTSNAERIVVREVIASGIELAFERRGQESNFEVLQRNAIAETQRPVIVKLSEPPKVVLDYFTSRAGKMTIRHDLLGQGTVLDGTIAPVSLSGIGRREGGVVPAQVVVRLITALNTDATRSALAQVQQALAQRPR
jgi:hypothetical protein